MLDFNHRMHLLLRGGKGRGQEGRWGEGRGGDGRKGEGRSTCLPPHFEGREREARGRGEGKGRGGERELRDGGKGKEGKGSPPRKKILAPPLNNCLCSLVSNPDDSSYYGRLLRVCHCWQFFKVTEMLCLVSNKSDSSGKYYSSPVPPSCTAVNNMPCTFIGLYSSTYHFQIGQFSTL